MLSKEELSALREDYSQRGLRRAELVADPLKQFNLWLAEAKDRGILEPNAMTLATVDGDGRPWTRTVLLKVCDERGLVFFTNYEGAKAGHLAVRNVVALTFWWGGLERQVNITGRVEKTAAEESSEYFHSRPVSSQLGAWASAQSTVVADRAELEAKYAEVEAQYVQTEVPCPPHWGGFRVFPETLEFWQGRRSRLHDRFRYCRESGGGWKIERLAP